MLSTLTPVLGRFFTYPDPDFSGLDPNFWQNPDPDSDPNPGKKTDPKHWCKYSKLALEVGK